MPEAISPIIDGSVLVFAYNPSPNPYKALENPLPGAPIARSSWSLANILTEIGPNAPGGSSEDSDMNDRALMKLSPLLRNPLLRQIGPFIEDMEMLLSSNRKLGD